jgi:hypothetical protein
LALFVHAVKFLMPEGDVVTTGVDSGSRLGEGEASVLTVAVACAIAGVVAITPGEAIVANGVNSPGV